MGRFWRRILGLTTQMGLLATAVFGSGYATHVPVPPIPPVVRAPLNPGPGIASFGLFTPITGGANSAGIVELDQPAPTAGVVLKFSISGNTKSVIISAGATHKGRAHTYVYATLSAASVTVTAGQKMGLVIVKTLGVPGPTPVTVTVAASFAGSLSGSTDATASFVVEPPVLSIVGCYQAYSSGVAGGAPFNCTVWLNGPVAAWSSAQIAMTTTFAPSVVPVLEPLVIPGDNLAKTVTIATSAVATDTAGRIVATYDGVTESAPTLVLSPRLAGASLVPPSLVGGNPVKLSVTLSSVAPAAGAVIGFNDNNPTILSSHLPSSAWLIPAGKTQGQFELQTTAVKKATAVSAIAWVGPTATGAFAKTMKLTVNPPAPAALGIAPIFTVDENKQEIDPSTITGGEAFQLAIPVRNYGAGASGPSTVIVTVNAENAGTSQQQSLTVPALGSGDGYVAYWNFTSGLPDDVYDFSAVDNGSGEFTIDISD